LRDADGVFCPVTEVTGRTSQFDYLSSKVVLALGVAAA
jgi:hypothetical protein